MAQGNIRKMHDECVIVVKHSPVYRQFSKFTELQRGNSSILLTRRGSHGKNGKESSKFYPWLGAAVSKMW